MIPLLTWFGVNNAFAASSAAHASQKSGLLASLPMLLAFGFIFYFLLLRPQLKQQKQQKKMLRELAKGDEAVSSGGIVGTIKEVDEQFVTLVTPSKVELSLQKRSISQILPKGSLKESSKAKPAAKSIASSASKPGTKDVSEK